MSGSHVQPGGWHEHRYLLGSPCKGCGRTPEIMFRESIGMAGEVGPPYLHRVVRCCARLDAFTFMGAEYRMNATGRITQA